MYVTKISLYDETKCPYRRHPALSSRVPSHPPIAGPPYPRGSSQRRGAVRGIAQPTNGVPDVAHHSIAFSWGSDDPLRDHVVHECEREAASKTSF